MRYLIVLLLVTGCAAQPRQQYQWVNDRGADVTQLRRDQGQCEATALGQHPRMSVDQGMHIYASCMRSKGWALAPL